MGLLDRPLGRLTAGTQVRVDVTGPEANVRLVEEAGAADLHFGRGPRAYGGHYARSPIYLTVPRDGRWRVTIDLGGASSSVRATVQVLANGALSPQAK